MCGSAREMNTAGLLRSMSDLALAPSVTFLGVGSRLLFISSLFFLNQEAQEWLEESESDEEEDDTEGAEGGEEEEESSEEESEDEEGND